MTRLDRTPVVSVVTIFLDAGKFLGECVESVLGQTLDDWELLLVDDGSTDGSTEIAREAAERDPDRVRYLEHEGHRNLGKSVSRNLGIRAAHGEYLALLDADDVYLEEKLERQVALMRAHPEAGMVYGPTRYWFGWTGDPADARRDFEGKLGVEPGRLYPPPSLLTMYLRDGGTVPCTCGLLARRDLVVRTGAFEESVGHLFEDQVLLAKLCLEAPVLVDGGCQDLYRQHAGSSSNVAIESGEYHPTRPNPAHLAYLTWLARYVEKLGIEDMRLKRALRAALMPYRHPLLHRMKRPFEALRRRLPR